MKFSIIIYEDKEMYYLKEDLSKGLLLRDFNRIGESYLKIINNYKKIYSIIKTYTLVLNEINFNISLVKLKKSLKEVDEFFSLFIHRILVEKYGQIKKEAKFLNKDDTQILEKFKKYVKHQILDIFYDHYAKFLFFLDEKEFSGSNNEMDFLYNNEICIPNHSKILMYIDKDKINPILSVFYEYCKKYKLQADLTTNFNAFLKSIEKLEYLKIYNLSFFKEFLDINFDILFEKKTKIIKCKNCGKYFIPHNKQVYCNNISPQDLTKKCIELSDNIRNNDNIIQKIYRKYYKKAHSIVCNNIKEKNNDYETWLELSKELKVKYKKDNKLKIENFEDEMYELFNKYMK